MDWISELRRRVNSGLEAPIYSYSRMRSLNFTLQRAALTGLWQLFGNEKKKILQFDPKTIASIHRHAVELLRQDAQRIQEGYYPLSVLLPESPLQHFRRVPGIFLDAARVGYRRSKGRTADFSRKIREKADELPRYYRRNFHFQTDGYLSEASAWRYDHQVEVLFGGTADAMRRLIIPPMKNYFGKTEGKGLHFLEVGAGTGRATAFLKLAFPKARITVTDLSEPYLKVAREKLSDFSGLDFVQADAAHLPFAERKFDGVFSVFLFHELPLEERRAVLKESMRVLKPSGFLGLVDSIQKGDIPELEGPMEVFPKEYHEPFYRNYVENPLEVLLKESGYEKIQSEKGFFSKACYASKSAS